MKRLLDYNMKKFLVLLVVLQLFLIMGGVFFLRGLTVTYKEQLIQHDSQIVGYLLERGSNPLDVAHAFISSKTKLHSENGKNFLSNLAYVPNTQELASHNAMVFFSIIIGYLFVLLIVCIWYFSSQLKQSQNAIETIGSFMAGNYEIRIDSEHEGVLAALYSSINKMATTLHTHVETEVNLKEFLKMTISDISHQLKTPLTAIKMYNEIIQEEPENIETVKRFTGKTASSLERMELLILNLLKITKLDAGMIFLERNDMDLYELLQSIRGDFETRAEYENKTITMDNNTNLTFNCDKVWITEALGNLIKNALDHTKDGDQIHIAWSETSIATKIIILDNGNGILKEDIHHIFKRFYRSRFSSDSEGIGLGLSLTKAIVEAHNGMISVCSDGETGSTFTMNFLKLTKE